MLDMLLDAIGPVGPWLPPLALGSMLALRRAVRRRHLKALAIVAGLAFFGFWALLVVGALILGFAAPAMVHGLGLSAGVTLFAGSAALGGLALHFIGSVRLDG